MYIVWNSAKATQDKSNQHHSGKKPFFKFHENQAYPHCPNFFSDLFSSIPLPCQPVRNDLTLKAVITLLPTPQCTMSFQLQSVMLLISKAFSFNGLFIIIPGIQYKSIYAKNNFHWDITTMKCLFICSRFIWNCIHCFR